MTLHEDVARINEGDTVTAEFRHHDGKRRRQYEITGPVHKAVGTLMLGPFTLCFTDEEGTYATTNLMRIVHVDRAPAPLYANRPDIKGPRQFDVVVMDGTDTPCLTFADGYWRGHGGSRWDTEELTDVATLTLVAEAIP